MKTYRFTIGMLPNIVLPLGIQGENNTRKIIIDYTEWVKEGYEGYPQIAVLRPDGETYIPTTTIEEEQDSLIGVRNLISWVLVTQDTNAYGMGLCSVAIIDSNESVLKSASCRTKVEPTITGDIPDAPADFKSWMDQLMLEAAKTKINANLAERYSGIAGAYAESCVGGDEEVINALLLKAIAMEIGTVTTLEPGSQATVTVGDGNVISFGIPKGEKGDTGETGATGPQGPEGPQGPAGSAVATIASSAALGCIKVGNGLDIVAENGTLSVAKATDGTIGGIIVGNGLEIDASGVLSATGTESPEMTGATSGAAGAGGTVPAPAAGDNTKFLCGDATWATPPNATTLSDGLMSSTDKSKLDGIAARATETVLTKLWQNSNPYQNYEAASFDLASYSSNPNLFSIYDLILIRFIVDNNGSTVPTRYMNIFCFSPAAPSVPSSGDFTFNREAGRFCFNNVSANKVGGRNFALVYYRKLEGGVFSSKATVEFDDGYYNGAKGNRYAVPYQIYGIRI